MTTVEMQRVDELLAEAKRAGRDIDDAMRLLLAQCDAGNEAVLPLVRWLFGAQS